ADGARSETPPRVSLGREHRHHRHRPRRRRDAPQLRPPRARARRTGGRALSHAEPRVLQGTAVSLSRQRRPSDAHAQHGRDGRAHQAHAGNGAAVLHRIRVDCRAADAREAPPGMRAAGWLLAAACVVLGIAAPLVVPALYGVLSSIGGLAPEAVTPPAASLWIGAGTTLGWLSPPLLALLAAAPVV